VNKIRPVFWLLILLVLAAALFTSTNPDGLDSVAGKLGFTHKITGQSAPMTNYKVSFLPAGVISTFAAGISGILIILAAFGLAVYFIKKNRTSIKIFIF
jgi:hypothetical protein